MTVLDDGSNFILLFDHYQFCQRFSAGNWFPLLELSFLLEIIWQRIAVKQTKTKSGFVCCCYKAMQLGFHLCILPSHSRFTKLFRACSGCSQHRPTDQFPGIYSWALQDLIFSLLTLLTCNTQSAANAFKSTLLKFLNLGT